MAVAHAAPEKGLRDLVVAIVGGTGTLGYGLAVRLAHGGVPVIIGSRDASRAAAAAERANETVRAAAAAGEGDAPGNPALPVPVPVRGLANPEAVTAASAVVVAVPADAQVATVRSIAPLVADRLVIDTTVFLRRGDPTQVDPPAAGSAAEQARELLPAGARLVAGLHTVSGKLLADLRRGVGGDVLICGDDPQAKAEAAELLRRIGARVLDAGGLEAARTLERLTALVIGMNIRYRRRHIGLRFTGLPEDRP